MPDIGYCLIKLTFKPDIIRKSYRHLREHLSDKISRSTNVVSSASCDILSSVDPTFISLIFVFALVDIANTSTSIMKRYGDIGHLCRIPLFKWKWSEVCPSLITVLSMLLYKTLTQCKKNPILYNLEEENTLFTFFFQVIKNKVSLKLHSHSSYIE